MNRAAENPAAAGGGAQGADGVVGARSGVRIGMIVGPTAAGKTAFSLDLAERLGAEIVNADSRQLYRGMDIGTAKPSAADRARIPHHLIDVREPDDPADAAQFAALAHRAIAGIAARGRPVLVVGGSGLYLRVLRGGLFAGPPAAPEYRAELVALATARGAAYLHDRLREADAEASRRIAVNDVARIVRALEVLALSGIPLSEHHRRHRSAAPSGGYEHLAIGLTLERARLYERIDRRFDEMIAAGLVAEVRGLLAAGVRPDGVIAQTIGYREVSDYLAGKCDLPEAIARAQRESRRLAKRQLTWFRREPGVVWLDPERGSAEALARLWEYFGTARSDGSGCAR
jgi:tRNA dimethylallyltransferase